MKKLLLFLVGINYSLISQPQLTWAKLLDPAIKISKMEPDKFGNIIITGLFNTTSDFDPGSNNSLLIPNGPYDIFVAKYDPLGNFSWAFNLGNGNCIAYLDDLAIDTIGDIYITGTFNGSCTNPIDFDPSSNSTTLTPYGYIAKYGGNGSFQWAKSTEGTALQIDKFNSLVLATPNPNYGGINIIKYSSTGIPTSTLNFPCLSSNCYVKKIYFNSNNEMYILGNLDGSLDLDPGIGTNTVSGNDIFFAKYNNSGMLLFGNKTGTIYGAANDLYVDQQSNIYLTGYNQSWSNYYNIHISKWSNLGALLWFNNMPQNSTTVKSQGVRFIKNCNGTMQLMGVYTDNCGTFGTKFVFNSSTSYTSPCAASYTTSTADQIFIADVNSSDGSLSNIKNMGGRIIFSTTYKDIPIIQAFNNHLLLSGWFSNSTSLDFSSTDTTYTTTNTFIIDYNNCISGTVDIKAEEKSQNILIIYPNPASECLFISAKNHNNINFALYDITGKKVLEEVNKSSISIETLSVGIYYYQIIQGKNIESGKLIIQRSN